MNFVDVPVKDMAGWDDLEGVPHGAVTRHYFLSSVTDSLGGIMACGYDSHKLLK